MGKAGNQVDAEGPRKPVTLTEFAVPSNAGCNGQRRNPGEGRVKVRKGRPPILALISGGARWTWKPGTGTGKQQTIEEAPT